MALRTLAVMKMTGGVRRLIHLNANGGLFAIVTVKGAPNVIIQVESIQIDALYIITLMN